MQGKPESHKIPVSGVSSPPEFSTAVFKKQEQGMRIYWAYSEADGIWVGPKFAKTTLAGKPAMYKIYLITAPTSLAESPVNEFAQVLFPKINPLLFPKAETTVAINK